MKVLDHEDAFALLGPQLAVGQETCKAAVGLAIARIDQNIRCAVAEDEPRADDIAKAFSAVLVCA